MSPEKLVSHLIITKISEKIAKSTGLSCEEIKKIL